MHVDGIFKKAHDKDHHDHLGKTAFEIIQAIDNQHVGCRFGQTGNVDLADKQLIQPQRENQQYRRQQVAIDNFHHMGDSLRPHAIARGGIQRG